MVGYGPGDAFCSPELVVDSSNCAHNKSPTRQNAGTPLSSESFSLNNEVVTTAGTTEGGGDHGRGGGAQREREREREREPGSITKTRPLALLDN